MKNVQNVNKGKRRKRKHHYNVGTPVVFKWWGDREYGFISELTNTKDGYATYTIRSTKATGAIYNDMEVDDTIDYYSYISTPLTKSIKADEVKKIRFHYEEYLKRTKPQRSSNDDGVTVYLKMKKRRG